MSHFNPFPTTGFYPPTNPNFNPTPNFNPNFPAFDLGTSVYVVIEIHDFANLGPQNTMNSDKLNLNGLGNKALTIIGVYENINDANLAKGTAQNKYVLTSKLHKSMYKTSFTDPLYFNPVQVNSNPPNLFKNPDPFAAVPKIPDNPFKPNKPFNFGGTNNNDMDIN